jgi:peptide/nickel transport system permease protein
MNRYRFVLHRPLQLVAVAFGIGIVTFVLVHLIPGDPARTLLGIRATPTAIANIRDEYGLDEPQWRQYAYFLERLAHGELGETLVYKIDVNSVNGTRLEPTLWLMTGSVVVLSLLIGVATGRDRRPTARSPRRSRGARRVHARDGPPAVPAGVDVDRMRRVAHVLPVSAYGASPGAKLAHLVLPILTVAVSLAALLTRSLRASLVRALDSDVATAARARGMPESVVFWRHALPNSLGQTINLLAVNAGWLLGGTVVVESVFALPGIGQLLVRGILARDYLATRGSIRVTPSC